jgi:hypothetical protein
MPHGYNYIESCVGLNLNISKVPRKTLNTKVAPGGRIRGSVERALLEIAVENMLSVTETTFEEAALAKSKSRRRDDELIRTGKATSEEIQKKNSFSSGPFRIVDYRPLFSALDEAQA